MWKIYVVEPNSILADFRPMGYKLSCCGSLWSRLKPFIQICSRTLCHKTVAERWAWLAVLSWTLLNLIPLGQGYFLLYLDNLLVTTEKSCQMLGNTFYCIHFWQLLTCTAFEQHTWSTSHGCWVQQSSLFWGCWCENFGKFGRTVSMG